MCTFTLYIFITSKDGNIKKIKWNIFTYSEICFMLVWNEKKPLIFMITKIVTALSIVIFFSLSNYDMLSVYLQGKFIRINFDASGYISGANIETCILWWLQ